MIVVGATVAPYKMGERIEWGAWLDVIGDMADDARVCGHDLNVFLAAETDARGLAPYEPLTERLADVLRTHGVASEGWSFSLDTGAKEWDGGNRIPRICHGRNMITDYATAKAADWILHLDTDTRPDPKTISKLLALRWPIVGGDVPSYCLSGPEVHHTGRLWLEGGSIWLGGPYDFPVQRHWNTAGYLMVHSDVFSRLRWGSAEGVSDDPWYQARARDLGWPTLVRKDCIADHRPLVSVEDRDHDRTMRR